MRHHRPVRFITLGLAVVLCAAAFAWYGAGVSRANAAAPCDAPAIDKQKAVATAAMDAIWNGREPSAIDSFVAGDFRYQEAGSAPLSRGVRGVAFLTSFRRHSFPDLTYAIDEMVAEGDRVAVRWTATGTHQGAYGFESPTGAQVSWSGVSIFEITDGKVSAAWVSENWPAVERQLGIDRQATWGPAYYR
jgi:predicted ester cyclase